MDKEINSSGKETKYCDECGGTLQPDKIKLEEFEGGKLYVINDAPVLVCQTCGEIWVPETIINELEQMIELSKKRKMLKLKKVNVRKPVSKKKKKK
ncbi:YgiT-type zinc finger protein [Candidatus Margulisiibacteriota bacterium]